MRTCSGSFGGECLIRVFTDMAELRKIAESYIRNELIRLEGVAEVTLSGEEVSTFTIQTDPYKLDAFQLKNRRYRFAHRIETIKAYLGDGSVNWDYNIW